MIVLWYIYFDPSKNSYSLLLFTFEKKVSTFQSLCFLTFTWVKDLNEYFFLLFFLLTVSVLLLKYRMWGLRFTLKGVLHMSWKFSSLILWHPIILIVLVTLNVSNRQWKAKTLKSLPSYLKWTAHMKPFEMSCCKFLGFSSQTFLCWPSFPLGFKSSYCEGTVRPLFLSLIFNMSPESPLSLELAAVLWKRIFSSDLIESIITSVWIRVSVAVSKCLFELTVASLQGSTFTPYLKWL